jgi:hypothetical protein
VSGRLSVAEKIVIGRGGRPVPQQHVAVSRRSVAARAGKEVRREWNGMEWSSECLTAQASND